MANVYFELTKAFNAPGLVAVLGSGQAVVFHRLAIMSKDGDWIVRETEGACAQILAVLEAHGARYRPAAPLDVRWLRGGWSSHLEYRDDAGHRIRCDFFSRPPRLTGADVDAMFASVPPDGLAVVGLEPLVRMKQTQRAKDYAVISELARLLPPERELELTWDPDRILALARAGVSSERRAVLVARTAADREEVAVALARQANALQVEDARRVATYVEAGRDYMRAFQREGLDELVLPEAHAAAVDLAVRLLPERPEGVEGKP